MTSSPSPLVRLQEIHKAFAGLPVLRGVSLDIHAGEIVVILGPSGSGKTTLLRIIAGLEAADSGRLFLEGQELSRLPVHERRFGMVFQDYALFPHKNVMDNVAFGLRMSGWGRSEQQKRAAQMLSLVGMAGYGRRSVHELSGGEQQRVALARALAPGPRLLLLDEPLGSLDRALRERLLAELRAILNKAGSVLDRRDGITAVYVTHDQEEAFAIADQIVVLNEGLVEQMAPPVELYRRPGTAFVARFLDLENLFPGRVMSSFPPLVQTPLGTLQACGWPTKWSEPPRAGMPVTTLVRPGAARVVPPGELSVDDTLANRVAGKLVGVSFRGRYRVAWVELPGRPGVDSPDHDSKVVLKLFFELNDLLPKVGTLLKLELDPAKVIILEEAPAHRNVLE